MTTDTFGVSPESTEGFIASRLVADVLSRASDPVNPRLTAPEPAGPGRRRLLAGRRGAARPRPACGAPPTVATTGRRGVGAAAAARGDSRCEARPRPAARRRGAAPPPPPSRAARRSV